MTDSPKKEDELAGSEQPFVQHLVELRDRMVKATLAIVVVAIALAAYPARQLYMTFWQRRWWRIRHRVPS